MWHWSELEPCARRGKLVAHFRHELVCAYVEEKMCVRRRGPLNSRWVAYSCESAPFDSSFDMSVTMCGTMKMCGTMYGQFVCCVGGLSEVLIHFEDPVCGVEMLGMRHCRWNHTKKFCSSGFVRHACGGRMAIAFEKNLSGLHWFGSQDCVLHNSWCRMS